MIKPTVGVVFMGSLLLYGCQSLDKRGDARKSFIGEKKEVLIAALGEPKYTIDTTFDDAYASTTFIYPTNPKVGCVESYKIEVRSGKVIDYSCR